MGCVYPLPLQLLPHTRTQSQAVQMTPFHTSHYPYHSPHLNFQVLNSFEARVDAPPSGSKLHATGVPPSPGSPPSRQSSSGPSVFRSHREHRPAGWDRTS